MSLFTDTVLPGRLYIAGGKNSKGGPRTLRKSQSHGTLLSPLLHLVQDPFGTIGKAVGGLNAISEDATESVPEEESRKQVLYLRMNDAQSYEEWKAAATDLDILEGNEAWKQEDESSEYDYGLVKARLQQLDEARLSCDVKNMLFLVRTSLTRGLGGMGDLRLYKHSHIGTKSLIERYIDSVQKTLAALLDVSSKQRESGGHDSRELMDQLLATRQSFGRSALLLSGGGTFGMNHIGVVKSLWEARLLPRLISGASAGSIVCAVLCTRTDAQIPEVLQEFCYGDLAVFEKEGEEDSLMKKAVRFLKYGALFDINHLTGVMKNLLGDITFQEAYNRTRRILNITVSSASLYELPRLLNYVTAPNVIIWSAVCASCSVPLVFSAASLLAKDPRTGKEVPWNPTDNVGWIDGSVDNDVPMTRLAEMFNVNHFIVSQVNPHVVPFLVKEEGKIAAEARQSESAIPAGPSWIQSIANLAKGEALHRLHVLAEMGIFPNYLSKARSVLNQRYSGDITILPDISYAQFPKVLSNPTTEFMLQCMLTGERATWPKLSRVQNHVAIELALDETIRQLRARVVFSPSQVDLRLNSFRRPYSQGADLSAPRPLSGHQKIARFESDTTPPIASAPIATFQFSPLLPAATIQTSNPNPPFNASRSFANLLEPLVGNIDATSSSEPESGHDTDASELLSSPSPPSSPTHPIPPLWSSAPQLFPSASQSATPARLFPLGSSRRNNSLLDMHLAMTADSGPPSASTLAPSTPELRYKHLFHSPTPTRSDPEVNVKAGTKPLPSAPILKESDSLPEAEIRSAEHPIFMSPMTSPRILKKPDKNDSQSEDVERRSTRHGSGFSKLVDLSGTKSMLRRKKSSRRGNTAA